MKVIDYEIEIPRYKNATEITILGDVHKGNMFFDNALFDKYYEGGIGHRGFKTDKNMYVLTTGDLMETCMAESAGVQDQDEWIEDQYLWIKDMLEPIEEDDRLIGMIEGNHERRLSKNWFRTTRLLSRELNIPYSMGTMVINIILKKGGNTREYKICAAHGKGWSRTVGGKFNTVYRLNSVVGDADAYKTRLQDLQNEIDNLRNMEHREE